MCAHSFIHVQLCAALWTVAHQAPLSLEFSRQEYWRGLLFPPRDFPYPGIKPHISYIGRRILYHWATWDDPSTVCLTSNNNLVQSQLLQSPAALEIIIHIKLPWGSRIEQLFPCFPGSQERFKFDFLMAYLFFPLVPKNTVYEVILTSFAAMKSSKKLVSMAFLIKLCLSFNN